jgi:hypothetical protein
MSGVLILMLIFLLAAWWCLLGGRLVFEPAVSADPSVFTEPARYALWVGSSYWGTRNRHPPTGHTPLDAVDKSNDPDNSRSAGWLSGMGGSGGSRLSNLFARQSQGVIADFWYPSMRRATPATAAQRRPCKVSKLRQRHRSQAFENGVTPGCNP